MDSGLRGQRQTSGPSDSCPSAEAADVAVVAAPDLAFDGILMLSVSPAFKLCARVRACVCARVCVCVCVCDRQCACARCTRAMCRVARNVRAVFCTLNPAQVPSLWSLPLQPGKWSITAHVVIFHARSRAHTATRMCMHACAQNRVTFCVWSCRQ